MIAGAAALSAILLHLTTNSRRAPRAINWRQLAGPGAAACAVAIFTGLAILSNFFRNPAAIAGTFAALTDYVSRGISGDSSTFGASVHDHPSWYYLQLLAWPAVSGPWRWSEGGTLLLGVVGLVACVRGWMRGPRAWHFIAVITILLTAFYSAIPYKTPWNVLPMLTGWTFLAGRGFAAIVRWVGRVFAARRKPHLGRFAQLACAAVLMIWPALLAIQTWRATIKMPADIRNPYAYSPTSPSVFRLEKRAEQIADAAPAGHNIIIQIISPDNDYWPLPWYLRRFLHIGYYTELADASPDADIIISAVPPDDETLQRIGPRAVDFYGLRAEIMVQMLIRQPLWDAFMARAGN